MKNERGVTLIEMILSIILIAIIGVVAAQVFLGSTKAVLTGDSVREAAQTNRLALDRMVREIRTVRDNKCVGLADDKDLIFVDSQNRTIEFSWAGTSGDPLIRTENGTPNILVNHVSSLVLTYYNNADPPTDITSAPAPGPPLVCPGPAPPTCDTACAATDIWTINIDLTTQSGTETMRLRSQAHPRSF